MRNEDEDEHEHEEEDEYEHKCDDDIVRYFLSQIENGHKSDRRHTEGETSPTHGQRRTG